MVSKATTLQWRLRMSRDDDEPRYTVYRSRPRLFGRKDSGADRAAAGMQELRERAPDAPRSPQAPDGRVEYTKQEASEHLRLAYALTVHKMQGSEVGYVILVLHEAHGPLLSRKLLYTAITRAKKGVIIVGQRSAILRAVAVEDTTRRVTNLKARLVANAD